MDEEYEMVDLLDEEFHHALLGCVYDNETGTPVPCYSSSMVIESLMEQGMSEDMAVDYTNEQTDGARILWIFDLELQPEFEPDNRPHLRLVH